MGHDPFTNSEDESFEINEDASPGNLEPGEYIGKLLDVEKGESKAGNPMFTWTFQVLTTEAGEAVNGTPELKTFTAITDKAMWKLEEVLGAMGLGKTEGRKLKAKFTKREAVGRYALLEVEDSDFNGQTRPAIGKVMPHPNGAGYCPDM